MSSTSPETRHSSMHLSVNIKVKCLEVFYQGADDEHESNRFFKWSIFSFARILMICCLKDAVTTKTVLFHFSTFNNATFNSVSKLFSSCNASLHTKVCTCLFNVELMLTNNPKEWMDGKLLCERNVTHAKLG